MTETIIVTREDRIRARWCHRKFKRDIRLGKRSGIFDVKYNWRKPRTIWEWIQANFMCAKFADCETIERRVGEKEPPKHIADTHRFQK